MNIIEKNYKWASKLSKRKSTKRIILHHAESKKCTADDIHRWHLNNGWAGIGYHFFIRKDGSIYRGRPEDVVGSHAKGSNSDSIGICFEGSYMTETMPDAQLKAGQELVSYLKGKYGITKVQRHKDVCSTNCPGTNFPFDQIAKGTTVTTAAATPTPPKTDTSTSTVNNLYDSWVANLQTEINKQGYKDYEGKTLKVDGIKGQRTLSACPTIRKGAKGNITLLIQKRLNSVGFNLKDDGSFGENTRQAVIKFQKNRGLKQDGIIGKNTWTWLLKGTKM